jgi:uncharacterized membrane protein YcaP (DUF421 family)
MADLLDTFLGLHEEAKDLTFLHMAARGFVVFVFAVVLARYADRRFMSRSACFDFMLAVVLGSVLSRGINGQAKFFPTLGTSALLVIFHQLVGMIAYHSHRFSKLVKGQPIFLVRDGRADSRELRRNHITEDDLYENLRLNGNIASLDEVAEARLERNGSVSVIKKRS